jgi:hypothetical protein
MEQITISGKDLGALALEDFCPRCFWLKMRLGNKLPYQTFPGIFSSIDSYTKKVTNIHFEKNGVIPKWLAGLGIVKPIKVPHWSKFFVVDPITNVHLRGMADDIFQKKDGSHYIIDYKTAKYTASQDHLLPMYATQLNSYAYIGNRTGYTTTGIGLAYYEPQTELTQDGIDDVLLDHGFYMPFHCTLHQLKLDPDGTIPSLLQKLRSIVDQKKAPSGKIGCENCELLDQLFNYVN